MQAVSGRSDDETVDGLEEVVAQGLVREQEAGDGAPAPSYDFSHEKLREMVYDETSLARRRLLHRRAAEALVMRARSRQSPGWLAGQIALPYRLGGHNVGAARYHQMAGDYARTLYANAEALAHFRSALTLGHPEAAALHEAIGDLQTLAGEYGGAPGSYETAAALGGPLRLAELEHKLGQVYERRGDGELAERHFEAAQAAFGEKAPGERSATTGWRRVRRYKSAQGENAVKGRSGRDYSSDTDVPHIDFAPPTPLSSVHVR